MTGRTSLVVSSEGGGADPVTSEIGSAGQRSVAVPGPGGGQKLGT